MQELFSIHAIMELGEIKRYSVMPKPGEVGREEAEPEVGE